MDSKPKTGTGVPQAEMPTVRLGKEKVLRTNLWLIGLVVVLAVALVATTTWAIVGRTSDERAGVGRSKDEGAPPAPAEEYRRTALRGYVRTVFPGEGRGLWEMAIGPDGTAWAAGSWGPELDGIATFDGETWVPTYDLPPGYNPFGDRHQVEIAPDGTMWAATEKGLARLDGETWTVVSAAPAGPIAFAPDGSVVAAVEEPSEVVTVRRFDGETWTTLGPGSGLGMKALAVAPDGTVWAANFSLFFGSISRFDGSAWTTWVPWGAAVVGSAWTSVRFDNGGGLDAPVEAALREAAIGEAGLGPTDMFVGFVPALTVATDGTAWATVKGGAPGVAALVRIEGDEWTFFPFAERAHGRFACLPPTPEAGLAIGPDGRVWVNRPCTRGVLYSFDGTTWRRGRGTPNSEREITAFEVAPDGTLWVASEESLVRFVSRAG